MTSQRALLLAFVATFFFSSAPAGVSAVNQDAYGLGILRLGLASLGMTVILGWRGHRISELRKQWTRRTTQALILVGLTFGLHWLMFFLSIKTASAATGAIGQSTYGVHLILLGALLGFGRISGIDVVSMALALAGTWLLVPEFNLQNNQTLGLLWGIGGGFAAACLPLLHQRYADVDGNLRAWGQFTFALPVFLCCLPWTNWTVTIGETPLVLYLGLVVTLLGHGLWVHATTALSTTTTSIVSYLYLPLSLLLGFLLIGEKLESKTLLGALLIFSANGIALWSQARRGSMSAITKNVEND